MRKNRTKSGKIMTVALAATFAVSLLAGCNGAGPESTEKNKGTTEISTEATTEKTEARATEAASTEAGMEAQTTATIDGEKTHATVEPTREQRKDECLSLVSMIQGNIGIENYEAALKQARKLVEQLEALVI